MSEEIAWIVENDVIQDSLVKELHHKNQVDVQYQSKVINYKLPKHADDAVHVTLEDGSHITTDLIVSGSTLNMTSNSMAIYIVFTVSSSCSVCL